MVGVPGRSKGCNTCIQRKIKCDQERPLCKNCHKANRICTGYRRPLGIVFSHSVPVVDRQSINGKENVILHQLRWKKTNISQASTPKHNTKPRIVWVQENTAPPSPRRQVSIQNAMRQQFHNHYLNGHIPKDVLEDSHPNLILPISWALQLQHVDIQSPALALALTALFSARVGSRNDDANLVSQSHSVYLCALQELRKALVNPFSRLSDETLATCITLLTYELTDRPTGAPTGFPAHLKGALAIAKLRGPDSITSPLSFSLFLTLRSLSAMHSLMHHHESIFSCSQWMQNPWTNFRKSPLDELTDLYFDMSAAMQQSNAVFSTLNQSISPEPLRNIITKLVQLDSDFRKCRDGFQNSTSGSLYWAQLSIVENCTDDPSNGKLFSVSYHFPSFFIGQLMVMYWNAMVLVHLHLSVAYDILAKLNPSSISDGTFSIKHDAIWRSMVDNLCKSAEYFSKETIGGLGPMTIFPYLYGAKLCLERRPASAGSDRHVRWISDCVQKMLIQFHFPVKNMLSDYETWKGRK